MVKNNEFKVVQLELLSTHDLLFFSTVMSMKIFPSGIPRTYIKKEDMKIYRTPKLDNTYIYTKLNGHTPKFITRHEDIYNAQIADMI